MSWISNREPLNIPLVFGPKAGDIDFQRIQNRMSLDCYKWDSQIGDVSTLCNQPLFISPQTWQKLKQMAEALAVELISAEQELLEHPELHEMLGLSAKLCSLIAMTQQYTPCAARTLRFDFHCTTEGWRVSEVNSDVPGGFTEASCFTELMANQYPNAKPTGHPANDWTTAMLSVPGMRGHVALLSAPGFLEDQQVTAFLASQLQARGVEIFLLHHPEQLHWQSGHASIVSNQKQIALDAIVRFYQGEWLAALPDECGWKWLFAGGKTPLANPGTALLTESKRLPLVWDRLWTKLTTWRRLHPECRDPQEECWQNSDEWVLKAAFSNTGDAVHTRDAMNRQVWKKLCRSVAKHPERWTVQRRFEPLPIASDAGAVYPCLGVYTVNGRAAGIYARASIRQIINYKAMDVAVLIDEN